MLDIIALSILVLTIFFCLRAIHYITSWERLTINEVLIKEAPLVSVLVPARNEEKAIGECLDSLLKQTYPNLEVIVIDDQSSDHTFEIVQEFTKKDARIKLIQSRPLPAGWKGKCWALYQGGQLAKGDWFLFSDADVIHNPLTVNSVYQYAVRNAVDFLTLKYTLLIKGFWEKVIPPSINFVKAWFYPSPKKVNNINTSAIEAKGDFIFVKRSIYEKLDGHQAVKKEFIESAALMGNFKKAGYKVALLDGSRMLKVRKFHNLKEIVASYSKLFYKFFQLKNNRYFFLLISLIILVVLSPIGILIFLLVFKFWQIRLSLILWPGLQTFIIFLAAMTYYKKDNFNPWYALGLPLGALIFIGIGGKALFELTIKKNPSWRGRIYS